MENLSFWELSELSRDTWESCMTQRVTKETCASFYGGTQGTPIIYKRQNVDLYIYDSVFDFKYGLIEIYTIQLLRS